MDTLRFATFWHGGDLSPYEAACLASFASYGYDVDLFSFRPMTNLPAGVANQDAREIVDEGTVEAFVVEGKPDMSHFSDYFRYKLFRQSDSFWIDSDMVCLRRLDRPIPVNLFVREQKDSLCAAIMRIASDHPCLPVLIEQTEAKMGAPLSWGATGPKLLTAYFGKTDILERAEPPNRFYPVHYTEFWKVFHPAFRDECRAFCEDADTLHLWNNLVVRAGIWKKFGPPEGSYLAEAFERAGCLKLFSELYPADVMGRLIENYIARDGAELGLKRIARLLVPGVKNTLRRRVAGDASSFLHHLPSASKEFQLG